MVAFTPGTKQRIAPNQFAYFLWVALCSQCLTVKNSSFLKGFLYSFMSADGALHCGTAPWQQQQHCGFIWCREEVKCVIDILADEHFSQMLDSEVFISWVNGGRTGCEASAKQCRHCRKVRDHIVHIDKLSFGGCCQTEHIKTGQIPPLLADLGWGILFLIREQLLCSHTRKGTEPKMGKRPLVLEQLVQWIHVWTHPELTQCQYYRRKRRQTIW